MRDKTCEVKQRREKASNGVGPAARLSMTMPCDGDQGKSGKKKTGGGQPRTNAVTDKRGGKKVRRGGARGSSQPGNISLTKSGEKTKDQRKKDRVVIWTNESLEKAKGTGFGSSDTGANRTGGGKKGGKGRCAYRHEGLGRGDAYL